MMKKEERTAILIALTERLKNEGSWCGETHIQKTVYLMKELLGVPVGLDFVLYKHGPFSFDLQDELSELRGDELLTVVPTNYRYGSSLKPTDRGLRYSAEFCKIIGKYDSEIQFVSQHLGRRRVADLEKIATALYVTMELGVMKPASERAARLTEYKPHIKIEEALAAVQELDQLSQELKAPRLVETH
jgi:uncharacterized protein YwgA